LYPHYIVCYGYDKEEDVFWISDPAETAPETISRQQLAEIWTSKYLLRFTGAEGVDKLQTQNDLNSKLNWLKTLVTDDYNILFTSLFIGCVVAVLGLSTAIFSQKLIDDIIPEKDTNTLLYGLALLLALLVIRSLLSFIRQKFILRQGYSFNLRIMEFFMSKLLRLPMIFFDNRKLGDLLTRINDTRRIQRAVANIISSGMIDVLLVLVVGCSV
jgi:ABC-type bacteriocin/lantibiotic exporter with double-glycine peptidase domain